MPDAETSPAKMGTGQRTAILLSLSCIADDPRVRRMGDFLTTRGWRVVAFGLPGAKSPPPAWPIIEAKQSPPVVEAYRQSAGADSGSAKLMKSGVSGVLNLSRWVGPRLKPAGDVLGRMAVGPLGPVARFGKRVWTERVEEMRPWLYQLNPEFVDAKYHHRMRLWHSVRQKGQAAVDAFWATWGQTTVWDPQTLRIMRATTLAHGERALWIANDWTTLPLAAECVAKFGGIYVYDSHEFAVQEYAERRDWVQMCQPLVGAIEKHFIHDAAVVTSVSPEITAALEKRDHLKVPTATLRNLPVYRPHVFRPTQEAIRVLYHGLVYLGRGLEETIASMPGWRKEFVLTIRGPGPQDYIQGLRDLALKHGVTDRVTFDPPVPAHELVARAAEFDVGMMILKAHSKHNSFALPNKVFEYMMAGLAICVTDLPSMATVVRESGAGVLVRTPTREAIAKVMNGLTRDRIDAFKRRALEAAKRMHFEADAGPVAQLYEAAWARAQAARKVR